MTLALLPISKANLNRKIHDDNFEEAVWSSRERVGFSSRRSWIRETQDITGKQTMTEGNG